MPCYPFLCDLSLGNLHPNSILAVSVFITLCEAYLGIQPHFNLFRHFYCLKYGYCSYLYFAHSWR